MARGRARASDSGGNPAGRPGYRGRGPSTRGSAPILPIAYAPIIAGGQQFAATPWTGQHQYGPQMPGQQQYGQRSTLW